jgi:ethanolamine ammonia-lyase small subunit
VTRLPRLPDLPAQWDDARLENPLEARAEAEGPSRVSVPDPWTCLRRYTPARIALGRAGTSLPTSEVLRFAAAHAQARDAVQVPLDEDVLERALRSRGHEVVHARSRAVDRADYLLRPDHGRALDAASRDALQAWREGADASRAIDVAVVVGDGLSAQAAQRHAPEVIEALVRGLWFEDAGPSVTLGPIVVARLARVALADEIGAVLGARVSLILLGERPGLAAPDSLGAYLTWAPTPGRLDAERNCVSNIRPEGQPPAAAAARLAWLVREALRRGVTGVSLKDDSELVPLGQDLPPAAIPPI